MPHTFAAYEDLLRRVNRDAIQLWSVIESEFIEATSAFDSEYRAGGRDQGWYKAKARYFNDLIVSLLSNATGKPMPTRRKKRSQLFEKLDIDVCYPDADPPVVGAEVKMVGTPPHPGNNQKGRPASQDMHKRIREVAFTSIDFKVAYSPPRPIGSFQNWIDSCDPGYFSFWAMRLENEADFTRVRTALVNLRTYCNGVGTIFYEARSDAQPTNYVVRKVDELNIDRNLREMAQRVS